MGGESRSLPALFCVIFPALLGNILEYYEYNAFTSLTDEINANLLSGFASNYPVWIIFGVGQACRPVGAILFGLLSDRLGRRQTIIASTVGMIVCTTGIGSIPSKFCCGDGWNTFGLVLLVIFRIGQGICASGEIASVLVFCIEHGAASQVGLLVALPAAASQIGSLVSTALSALLESALSKNDMLLWGWRLPFLFVLPLGIAIILVQRRMVEPPSTVVRESSREIMHLIATSHRWALVITFLLCSLQPVFQYGGYAYFKDFLTSHAVQPVAVAGWAYATAVFVSIVSIVLCGLLVDSFGAFRIAITAAMAIGLLIFPLWCLLVSPIGGNFHVYLAGGIFGLLFNELVPFLVLSLSLFPANVRATAFGLGYNLAQSVFGSSAPFINNAIVDAVERGSPGSWLALTTPSIFTVVGLMFSLAGLYCYHSLQPRSGKEAHPSALWRALRSPVTIGATLALLIDLTVTTVIVPFLPTYALSPAATSAVFVMKPVVEMLSNILAIGPSAADSMGPRRPAILGLVLITVGCLLLSYSDIGVLIVARFLAGIGASLLVPSMLKLIGQTFVSDSYTRDRVISLAMAGDALGGVVGPIIGSAGFNIAEGWGADITLSRFAPLLVVGVLCLFCLLMIFMCPDARPEEIRVMPLGVLLASRGVSAIAVAALAFGLTSFHIGMLESTSPILLVGYGPANSGYPWALVGFGFCIAAPFAVYFLRWFRAPPVCCSFCQATGEELHAADQENQSLLPTEDKQRSHVKLALSMCNCIGCARALRPESTSERAYWPGVAKPLRHSWASVTMGSSLLLGYSFILLGIVSQLSPEYTLVDSHPPAWFLVDFCIAMLLLGLALGLIYVPLNTYTQDITMHLFDQTALARTLGFLQGAKNMGLVIGYAVGPSIVGVSPGDIGLCVNQRHCGNSQAVSGSDDTVTRFQTIAALLTGVALFVGLAGLVLRLQTRSSLDLEKLRLLPKSNSGTTGTA